VLLTRGSGGSWLIGLSGPETLPMHVAAGDVNVMLMPLIVTIPEAFGAETAHGRTLEIDVHAVLVPKVALVTDAGLPPEPGIVRVKTALLQGTGMPTGLAVVAPERVAVPLVTQALPL
jgi:hypothetical protein